MEYRRIIPCLDIRDGQTVKGVNFVNIREAGDPVELARLYARSGADELTFLDITATIEDRRTFAELVEKIAHNINIPFTVGGGIKNEDDVARLLDAGADKITVNSAAVRNPGLIDKLAGRFGSQCVVLAVDCKQYDLISRVHLDGGRTPTDRETLLWVKEAVSVISIISPDGLVKIARTLPYGLSGQEGPDETGNMADSNFSKDIAGEVAMTVNYFKQKFREPAPDDIYILGDDRQQEFFESLCLQNSPMP